MYVSTQVQTYQSANALIYLLIYPLIYLIIYENRCTKVPKYKSTKVYLYLCAKVLMYQSVKVQTYNSTKALKYECTFARGPAIESLGTGTGGKVLFTFLPFYFFTFKLELHRALVFPPRIIDRERKGRLAVIEGAAYHRNVIALQGDAR